MKFIAMLIVNAVIAFGVMQLVGLLIKPDDDAANAPLSADAPQTEDWSLTR